MKNNILESSFNLSDSATEKVAFGGYIDGVEFMGEVNGFEKWDDINVYSGRVNPGDTEIILGYVVFNEDLETVTTFEWEEHLACRVANESAKTTGYEFSVGSVVLKKHTFIMRTTESEEIED